MKRLVSLVTTRQEITLLTHWDPPPIPSRSFDWCALDDKRYDYDATMGWGRTESAAIDALFDELLEAV